VRPLLVAAAIMAALPASAHAAAPGAAGIGDRLFPKLGNGGYDVQHYDVALNYATAAPAQGIDGTVTISAKATQALSRFDLDFAGDGLGSVSVDGRPAKFSRSGQELVITPGAPLPKGKAFTVTVAHYTAHPKKPSESNVLDDAFIFTPDGSATLGQPSGAHVFLPSNDHPRDKATFTFRFDVPEGETAVANGELSSQATADGRAQYVYEQREPMATELIQLAVGRYTVIDRGVQDGVHFRDVIAPSLEPLLAGKLPDEVKQLAWLKARLGTYPFSTYGSFVIDAQIGASLETQTLSIFDRQVFGGTIVTWPWTMVHETAHQWFGDSVSPREWSDVWLNEGHATWYQMLYAAEHGGFKEAALGVASTFTGAMKYFYEHGDDYRRLMGPVAKPKGSRFSQLFSAQQYYGGALVLYALRQKVGDAAFQKIERAWVGREAGRSASTADFIALASKVSHRHLGPFLHDWLYGTRTPPMPGHPGWKVEPVS
jgi:aminopeptidase N